jgi:hypothetical protein
LELGKEKLQSGEVQLAEGVTPGAADTALRFMALCKQHDVAAMAALCAPDSLLDYVAMGDRGRGKIQVIGVAMWKTFIDDFDDFHPEVVDVWEDNRIVDAFRTQAAQTPDADSGLRNPDRPSEKINYRQVSNDELFEIARLVIAAEIAKIHTIEWTTQLLFDEPLYTAMNSNWSGLFTDHPLAAEITASIVKRLADSPRSREANQFYSALAAGSGIVGHGNSDRFPQFLPKWLSGDR